MDIKITSLINNAIVQDGKREEREITSWHISALGSCLRGVYFQRLKVLRDNEMTAKDLAQMKIGSLIHDYIQKILTKSLEGKDIKIETEKRVEIPEFGATGYADIVLTNGDSEVVELKSANKDSFAFIKKQGPKENHQMQLWSYLYGLGIKQGRLIYLSKDYMDTQEFIFKVSDKNIEQRVRDEFGLLNKAWEAKNPLLLPLVTDWRVTYCAYHKNNCLK